MKNICRAERCPMRSLMLIIAACLTGNIAHADIEYVFNIQPQTILPAFSFSIISQTYLGEDA